MTIEEIRHYRDGKCIWSECDIPNIWHDDGQEFLLSLAFDTDGGIAVPTNYYLGLDNRTTLAATDTLTDLTGEPSTNGYIRQPLSPSTGFVVGTTGGNVSAVSGIGTFVATISQWGPVQNLFFATTNLDPDPSGFLISSASLGSSRTVISGESISVRITLSFSACA